MTISKPISYYSWRNLKINPPLTFEDILLPRVRRVFPRLLALDLVQVRLINHPLGQMDHPIGNLDFLDQIIMKKNHIPRKPISFGDWRRHKTIKPMIFSPYLPIYVEGNFQPRLGISSRYSTHMVNNRYYETIPIIPNTD